MTLIVSITKFSIVIGSPRDHVGVQLQMSDLNFFKSLYGFLSNVFYSFQNLGKALHTFSLKRSS